MADNGLQNDLYREVSPKKRQPGPLPKMIVMLVLAGVVGFYLFSGSEPARIVSMPEGVAPAVTTTSPAPSVIRPASESKPVAAAPAANAAIQARQNPGDSARALIAEFRAKKGPTDLKQIMTSADEFSAKGMQADAYLLYFFAARRGESLAAQVLAKMHDPAYYSTQNSVLDQPDLVQAYKWYRQAARGGQASAQNELNSFRAQVEQLAAGGDTEAKQLLLQWQ
ncbi:MAG: hypothetical protein L3J26_09965 [Candidatus Polarisedimenticolaceae bacterium]|nr:hypothetical protein [Candidatus Polarisedimenticolaceae bacterium]